MTCHAKRGIAENVSDSEAELDDSAVRVWQRSATSCSPSKAVYVFLSLRLVPRPSSISLKTASGGGGTGRRTSEASTRSRTPAMDNTANPNIHTIVRAQIVFLLSTLTEENFERNQVEIRSVRGLFLVSFSLVYADRHRVCVVLSSRSNMDSRRICTSFVASSYPMPASSTQAPPHHMTLQTHSNSSCWCKRCNVSHATLS